MVSLCSKNIKSTRPIKKLSERCLGPSPILKKVSTHAYDLKLLSQWKSIHPVFHISLLEPVKTSKIPNRLKEPPPPIIIEEEGWEVSQILDSKLKRGKSWYLVEWKGFSQDSEYPLWNQLKTSRIVLNLSTSSGFTLYWCLGAHHLKVGSTVTTMAIHLLDLHIAYPCHIHNHWPNWPFHLFWPFMAISLYGDSLPPS
ncbi:hypothetical protein O181_030655 [Austropuccinia psidii MF-1]|uniref:Chromo domain-containing protein n=1 Tax=Austropuccinia psidii MF-1 TaxID=1389203 RepID=A0A9Q3CXL4_9BASI|nr:hypothetical protein [Austropuccinia psidii MF-1]